MSPVIDLECYAPESLKDADYHSVQRGRPGTPFPEPLDRPEGYGFANYEHVFTPPSSNEPADDGGMEKLVADLDRAGIEAAAVVFVEIREDLAEVAFEKERADAEVEFLLKGIHRVGPFGG